MTDLERSPEFDKLNICVPDMLCQFNKQSVFKEKPTMMSEGKTANQQLRLLGKNCEQVTLFLL